MILIEPPRPFARARQGVYNLKRDGGGGEWRGDDLKRDGGMEVRAWRDGGRVIQERMEGWRGDNPIRDGEGGIIRIQMGVWRGIIR